MRIELVRTTNTYGNMGFFKTRSNIQHDVRVMTL